MIRRIARAVRRRLFSQRLECYAAVKPLLSGRTALEIGGPSTLFARDSVLPIYGILSRVDNCNFSRHTIWEGAIEVGDTFHYDPQRPPGTQFIAEASDLAQIPPGRYDCVLSSHTLEHAANPVKVLHEFMRVLTADGLLVLVLPHKEGTFDHRRPVTPLAHLLEDAARGTTEHDLTHLPEILACHDLARDPAAGDFAAFKARSERNIENRCLHHHVFDTQSAVALVDCVGLQLLAVSPVEPHDIFLVARKCVDTAPTNARFAGPAAVYRATSPFAIDRA